ncbi:hypothetical protein BCU68_07725 [Vibrio sp. 10N.286.49.B3]|uniref:MliC family protein n=1 Tax=Vibrio sp. 10N.286.49.B3 TaxID=1880855 RepID=UPI000CC84D11|nr:MliC family protein [Vibrio sp. 10N.286.49.B3]PMH37588.1 hypothetical protein BCU68_07725 [Vibrio sp. 10N.286.49.B3]
MKMNLATCSLSVIALVGCSQPKMDGDGSNKSHLVRYLCGDDGFSVLYLPDKKALLEFRDETFQLIQVPSGSGIKYITDDRDFTFTTAVTLYSKGEEAIFEFGRAVFADCRIKL